MCGKQEKTEKSVDRLNKHCSLLDLKWLSWRLYIFLNELFLKKYIFASAHKRMKTNKKEFSEFLEKEYLSNFNRN